MKKDAAGNIIPVTTTILGNEKAQGLMEVNRDKMGVLHRYQLIYVIRNDRIAEFAHDMGPSKNYKGVRLLNIPSLMEHTVDELKDIADEIRCAKLIDIHDLLKLDRVNLV